MITILHLSSPYCCSANIINQHGKHTGLIPLAMEPQKRKILNHFLKRFGLNGLYHCVTKWAKDAIFVIYIPGFDRLAALPTKMCNVSIHISGMAAVCTYNAASFISSVG